MGKKFRTNNKIFKKNKEKRAFTLIELLAVILILGIIALIAGSTIYNMVEHSRKEAYKATVRGVLKSAEHYVTSYPLLNRGKISYPVVFTCDGKECSNGIDKLELQGKLPVSGQVIIEDSSNIKASYLRSDRYCAFGDKVNIEINKDCDKVDTTNPTSPTKGELGPAEGNNPEGKIKDLPAGSTDDHSEVTYLYLVLNEPSQPNKDDKRFSTKTTYQRACGKDYYGWAVAQDASGNRSDVYYLGEAHDGENVYSEWSQCTKECDGGVKTRTNTCSLITEDLSEECNTQSCLESPYTAATSNVSGGLWTSCSVSNYDSKYVKSISCASAQRAAYYVGAGPQSGSGSLRVELGGYKRAVVTVRCEIGNGDNQSCSYNGSGFSGTRKYTYTSDFSVSFATSGYAPQDSWTSSVVGIQSVVLYLY